MKALVPALALLLAVGCNQANGEGADQEVRKTAAPANAMRVETAMLQPTQATMEIDLPGEIEGSRDANLASALGGFIEAVPASPGQIVSAGQTIARVDSDIYNAQVAQAEAQLAQAQAERARLDKLGDLATDQNLLAADTQVKVADAGLKQAKAQLKRAVVRAPFSGTVADTYVEAGEVAGPGATVARLVRLDPVIVSMSVPDRDVVALTKGMPVAVTANARSGIFQGAVTHIGAAANQKTRAFLVEVEVPNPDGLLLPGMIANVKAKSLLEADQLIIPQDWIVTGLEGQGVYVEADGAAKWRPLQLGAVVRDQVVVAGGIQPGEKIVVTGHRDIVDGDPLIVSRQGTCCENGRAVWPAE